VQPSPASLPQIGARLRAARHRAGLTQRALATALGCSQSAVSMWETDRQTPRLAHLTRLSAATGVSVSDLIEAGA
jgi:transcriptional regulator with XRE-family HTH domain